MRRKRIDDREYAAYGERICEGGDMYDEHCRFLDSAYRYDTDGSPNMAFHSQWSDSLPCPVLRLDGAQPLETNANAIVKACQNAVLHLRPLHAVDIPIILRWVSDRRTHALWCADRMPFPLHADEFARQLAESTKEQGDQAYVCAEGNNQPVGYFQYSQNGDHSEGRLKYVLVDPAQRGKGVGTQMIHLLLTQAFHHDETKSIRLNVFDANPAAIHCYQKAGFEITGTTPDAFAYQNERWSRISMCTRNAAE